MVRDLNKKASQSKPSAADSAKARVSQSDLPRRSLRDALTVAQAITDNFAGQPSAPHQIAMALDTSPTSSAWRELTGATVAYGLTKGAYNSEKIALEPLGVRATAPTEEGDDIKARAEAALKPKVFAQFFKKYNRFKFPPDNIAKNVLQHDFGVPKDRVDSVLDMIKDNGAFVGFIHTTKTGPFVSIENPEPRPVTIPTDVAQSDLETGADGSNAIDTEAPNGSTSAAPEKGIPSSSRDVAIQTPNLPFKVFITHSKNMEVVEQVKDVLSLYDIDYEIAVEEETAAIPVPQKIMAAMRRCQSGVMVVTADEQGKTADGYVINNNVLIEIGAAFVLYDQKVVLLWDKRLKVPSNLQGLYRCEFEGNQLSFAVGTRLAKALKGFKPA